MQHLATLAGVTHARPFHLYDDVKQQPACCELLVHPAHGWAIATELADAMPGLAQCSVTLATQICQQFSINPQQLTLLTRYSYAADYENWYALRFVSGERDLFDEIRFLGPQREMLRPDEVNTILQQLRNGQTTGPKWSVLPRVV